MYKKEVESSGVVAMDATVDDSQDLGLGDKQPRPNIGHSE